MRPVLTTVGIVLGLIGGLLMAPDVFGKDRTDRFRDRLHGGVTRVQALLPRVAGALVIVGFLLAFTLVVAAVETLEDLVTPWTSERDYHVLVRWTIIAGVLVPGGIVAAALAVATVLVLLWFLSAVLAFATEKPARLVMTGGILFVAGGVVLIALAWT